jgi:uncharacterized protein (TIGR02466 family)
MQTNTISLYSVDIYEFQCPTIIVDEVYEDIKNRDNLINWKSIETGQSKQTGGRYAKFAYDNNNLPIYYEKLFKWFDKCVDVVSKKYYNGLKLKIIDSWLTKTGIGQNSNFHKHSGSIISGLFYFHDCETTTNFKVENPWVSHLSIDTGYSILGSEVIKSSGPLITSVHPKKGKLLIWRSDIQHDTSIHKGFTNRYTLAFNTFCDGVISSEDTGRLQLKAISVEEQHKQFNKTKQKKKN